MAGGGGVGLAGGVLMCVLLSVTALPLLNRESIENDGGSWRDEDEKCSLCIVRISEMYL